MNGRRYAAVALPRLRIELALPEAVRGGAVAVVIARPGGAVKDERSLLGNTRLDEVSPEAWGAGIRRGQTIAAARARHAELRVRVVALDAVGRALAGVAEGALAFGATTAFELATSVRGDVVWVDVTGCAHLHASEADPSGERTLATKLAAQVRGRGHLARVAIADGPAVAAAVAFFAPVERDPIVPPGGNAAAMAALPTRALPMSEESIRWLAKMGARRVADLQALPRRALGTRLGASAAAVLALLGGDDPTTLVPHVPPEIPEEEIAFDDGVQTTDALVFVVKTLCDRLADRLRGRAVGATRLELLLSLDRALLPEGRSPCAHLAVAVPESIAAAPDLLRVLRAKIEAHDFGEIAAAPIRAATLRATELGVRAGVALDLFVPEAKADRALPRLVAELAAELGDENVGTLVLRNSWRPEARAELVPSSVAVARGGAVKGEKKGLRKARFVSTSPEPSRWLAEPMAVTPAIADAMRPIRLIARFEAIEWWRGGRACDVVAAWVDAPPIAGKGWVEVDRTPGRGGAWIRGWID